MRAAACSALALCLVARAASADYPCSFWQTWGQRLQVAQDPSEKLLGDALLCWCGGACAGDCAGWCASYAACEASGLASCAPTGGTDACDDCIYDQCAEATLACSEDRTGCATSCSTWLSGAPVCVDDTAEAVALSDCACSGACSAKCSASCGLGYLDTTGPVSDKCWKCLGKPAGCGGLQAACLVN